MGTIATTQPILEQAKRYETEYNWVEAAELYERAANALSVDESFQKGELFEKTGYAHYKAALQGETVDDFVERIRSAISAYEKAREFYAGARSRQPEMLRSSAMVSFLSLWLAPSPTERRRLIEQAW